MVITLGEKLHDFLFLCIESLITKNSNEIKTYELIKTIHELLKMGYLQHEKSVEVFNKLIPCLVHPNLLIRDKFIDLTKSLINSLSGQQLFFHLNKSLSDFFFVPLFDLNNYLDIDSILIYKKFNLDRVIYQLELNNILYNNIINNDDNSLELIKNMITSEREGDLKDT